MIKMFYFVCILTFRSSRSKIVRYCTTACVKIILFFLAPHISILKSGQNNKTALYNSIAI